MQKFLTIITNLDKILMARKRKCCHCKEYFDSEKMLKTPNGSMFCTYEHLIKYASSKNHIAQAKAKAHIKQKKAFQANDIKLRKKEAQTAFNAFIRQRDINMPCISCDKPNNGLHQRHASHYRSVGACSALRFNEYNVHASCAQCNSHMSGNISEYRIRLIKKIGIKKVEWLECQNEPTKYSCDELKRIELDYKAKLKNL